MTLKIEKNIPFPVSIAATARAMTSGDSVLFRTRRKAASFVEAMRAAKNPGAVMRRVRGGYRVWKRAKK